MEPGAASLFESVPAIALLEAGQLEVVGEEWGRWPFCPPAGGPNLGKLGAKQIARGPGLKLAGSPRSGAKAEASEADETNVDPMVTPPLPWRMKLPEGLDGLR
jgi:hypothetical protein